MSSKPNDAWEFWQRSRQALGELNRLMQDLGTAIAEDDSSLQFPHHIIKDVKRNLQRFQETFSCLAHTLKKASR